MNESSSMTRDEVLTALPGYVLEALEPAEKRAVELYLKDHPEMMKRVRELEAATGALALSAPSSPLPDGLKQKVLQRVQADLQTERPRLVNRPRHIEQAQADAQASGTSTAPIQPQSGLPGRKPIPRMAVRPRGPVARLRHWWAERRYANAALVMAGAMTALLIIVVFQAQGMLRDSGQSLAQVQARLATLETENQNLRTQNQALQEAVVNQRAQWATIISTGQSVALAGTEDSPDSQAVFYAEGGELLVIAAGLPALTEAQTYQLWLIPTDSNPVPAGLFDTVVDGTATFQATSPLPPADYAVIGISIEPSGGSPAPTGPIVLLGEVG